MEDESKKFNMVEIVLGSLLAAMNDILMIVADFGLAIPVVGEVLFGLAWLVDGILWALFMFWYIMKLGVFGGPVLVQTIAGLAEFAGVPSRLAGFILGVYMTNHPKVAGVAGAIAAGAVTGGVGGLAAEGAGAATAAEEGVAAGAAAVRTEAAAAEIEAKAVETEGAGRGIRRLGETTEAPEGKPSEVPVGKPSEASTERGPSELQEEKKPEVSEEALGEKPTEFEKLQKLLRETPQVEKKNEEEEEELDEAA